MERPDSAVPRPDADPAGRIVLTSSDISRALRRIAHEIIEHNKGVQDLVVLGIPTRGEALAQRIVTLLGEIEGAEFSMEESADGTHISATWVGEFVDGSCGREIRGTWQRDGVEQAYPFVMKKQ